MKSFQPAGSASFADVPPALVPDNPDRLLHAKVVNSEESRDHTLSRERHHFVRTVDLPSRVLSMTIGQLEPGQATRKHRHNYETIIYVTSGSGVSTINDREIAWQAGDAFYVPTWAWHQHRNSSSSESALYIACENAPLLQSLGIALREEQ
jgi:gentisate 1,2-dioxygenase